MTALYLLRNPVLPVLGNIHLATLFQSRKQKKQSFSIQLARKLNFQFKSAFPEMFPLNQSCKKKVCFIVMNISSIMPPNIMSLLYAVKEYPNFGNSTHQRSEEFLNRNKSKPVVGAIVVFPALLTFLLFPVQHFILKRYTI